MDDKHGMDLQFKYPLGTAVEGQPPSRDDTNGERVVEYRSVPSPIKLTGFPPPHPFLSFSLWFPPTRRKKAAEEAALKK